MDEFRKKVQWLRRPLLALLLAVALLVSPLAGSSARAVDADNCNLTITVGSDIPEDILNAGVVLDVYQIASAKSAGGDSFTFDWQYDLQKEYQDAIDAAEESGSDANWEALAQAASDAVLADGSAKPVSKELTAKSVAFEGMARGLYLIIPRGAQENYAADSALNSFKFAPIIIAVAANEEVNLKVEFESRIGSLTIKKELKSLNDGTAPVFTFKLTATKDGAAVEGIPSQVTISFTEPGTASKLVSAEIPLGTVVTVEELPSVSGYQLAEGCPGTQTITIEGAEEYVVTFTNEAYSTIVDSGSIVNHFEYTEEDGWVWVQEKNGGMIDSSKPEEYRHD